MDNFIFKGYCNYCGKTHGYYPFLLHGTIGMILTCKNCIDKAWNHYRSYGSCSWKPETKAKTMEEFMVLLEDQRKKSMELTKKLMAEREIQNKKNEEAIQKFHLQMSKRIDTILDIAIPDDEIFSLEDKFFYKLEKYGIELLRLENVNNKLILSCDKEISEDIVKILADIANHNLLNKN